MERQRPFLLKFEFIVTDTTSSEETKARFRLHIDATTCLIPVTEKDIEGHAYIGLSSNTHLKVVSPRLKCFCTFNVPVIVFNSNTGVAFQAMGFARTTSISLQSVSPSLTVRSPSQTAKLYLLSGWQWFYDSQFAVRPTKAAYSQPDCCRTHIRAGRAR